MGKQDEDAIQLHNKAIIINALNSTRFNAFTSQHVEKLRQGGWTAANFTVSHPTSVLPTAIYEPNFRRAIQDIYLWYGRLYEIGYDKLSLIKSAADIKKAKDEKRAGIILGFQSGNQIEELGHISIFQRLGVRVTALSYMYGNWIADGPLESRNAGLTYFGEKVIDQLNELGIVIDLSHVGERSAMDAVEASKDPVILSHSNPKSLVNVARNAPDELIQAIAEKDGVIGIAALKWFIMGEEEDYRQLDCPIGKFVDHIKYAIDLVGINHVGLGLDVGDTLRRNEERARFNVRYPHLLKAGWKPAQGPEERYVPCLTDPTDAIQITKALVEEGFSDVEIQKILGLNLLRVFEKVWKDTDYGPPTQQLASIHPQIIPPAP
jgi:membrane dipeptidase